MSGAIINSIAYDREGHRIAKVELADTKAFLLENPESFLWIGLHEPDAAMVSILQEQFGLGK